MLEKRNYDDRLPTLTVREASMAKIKKGVAVANEVELGWYLYVEGSEQSGPGEGDRSRYYPSAGCDDTKSESVEPEMTLLDALHLMHDQKYLHLPVVANGTAKGLVDAMDVMDASQGDGKGSDGWRSFWEQTMTSWR